MLRRAAATAITRASGRRTPRTTGAIAGLCTTPTPPPTTPRPPPTSSKWIDEVWKSEEPEGDVLRGRPPPAPSDSLHLLHEPLTRPRLLDMTFPGGARITLPFTFSNLAGHGSFVFLMASYLETDFLNLRLYALSGITLSLVFQYFREKPLLIPVRWNSLFWLINAVMIFFLVKENSEAEDLMQNEEQKVRTFPGPCRS